MTTSTSCADSVLALPTSESVSETLEAVEERHLLASSEVEVEYSTTGGGSDSGLIHTGDKSNGKVDCDPDLAYVSCPQCNELLKSGRGQLERHLRNYCSARECGMVIERKRRRSRLSFSDANND